METVKCEHCGIEIPKDEAYREEDGGYLCEYCYDWL